MVNGKASQLSLTFLAVVVMGAVTVARQTAPGLTTPASLQAEHDAIHKALEEATKAPGQVGAAAKELAKVLHPHFVREQQIALPPLGLLKSVADGTQPAQAAEVLAMTDALKRELPGMLQDHTRIRAAVGKLREAAKAAKAPKYEKFAEDLAEHARTEEDVLYPAAVLVGEVVRLRRNGKW